MQINPHIMKRIIITFAVLFLIPAFGNTQPNKALCTQQIIWLGIDYSHATFVDEYAFYDSSLLKNDLFKHWNNLVFKERKKYDIGRFFNKEQVNYNTKFINQNNLKTDIANQIINFDDVQNQVFNKELIQQIVSGYNLDVKDGVGLVFITEYLNGIKSIAAYWITFIDLKTKKVLLTDKVYGKPSGIKPKNYWANSFYNAMVVGGKKMGFYF